MRIFVFQWRLGVAFVPQVKVFDDFICLARFWVLSTFVFTRCGLWRCTAGTRTREAAGTSCRWGRTCSRFWSFAVYLLQSSLSPHMLIHASISLASDIVLLASLSACVILAVSSLMRSPTLVSLPASVNALTPSSICLYVSSGLFYQNERCADQLDV